MKIKFYGTCAAEGFPAMFCDCEVCKKARELGGKNIRTRSQACVDDVLLLDFPADTYMHVLTGGLDLKKVEAVLITHGHDDHLYPMDILYREEKYGHHKNPEKKTPLGVYSTKKSGENFVAAFNGKKVNERDPKALIYKEIEPFCQYEISGYKVTPLKADHAKNLDPVFYIIEKDSKALLYAHDTGYFPEETWSFLEESNIKFDFVSLDCTSVMKDDAVNNHMGLKTCCQVKQRLLNKNADESTVFILNHFSHNGGYIYDELVPVAREEGFLVSFDGAEFEI
jgi:phosphoribosyl 1,2-cyclic phosphate phosphodiesterase